MNFMFTLLIIVSLNASGAPFNPPADNNFPSGSIGKSIEFGYKIISETEKYVPKNVGNNLRCTSCHLNGGKTQWAAPWVGVTARFPQYRDRSGKVIRIEHRINACFQRSLNGKALAFDSEEMTAIVSYMTWLSKGTPVGESVDGAGFFKIEAPLNIDKDNGKKLFDAKCALCHGKDGQGAFTLKKEYLYPPLWGKNSFNIGAGMARLNTAAEFIYKNMPQNQPGTLTIQEAYDIAAYFTMQPRPDFKNKKSDWPLGNKPKDARY